MGFQLSNEEGSSSTTSSYQRPAVTAVSGTVSNESDTFDDGFDPAAEDTVFIANQYARSKPVESSGSNASYLSQKETFPPILMFFGVALHLLAVIVLLQQFKSGGFTDFIRTSSDLQETKSLLSYLASVNVLSFLGTASYLTDAIILHKKKIAGGSLIFWALVFPIVYYFQRCKANGNSGIFALLIVIVQLLLSGYTVHSGMTATITAMGIEINETGFSGASMAYARIPTLSQIYISVSGVGDITYDKLIASNITEPTYAYVEATDTEPALFVIKSTTPYGNSPIVINFEYETMALHSMTVGNKSYTSQYEIFLYLYNK